MSEPQLQAPAQAHTLAELIDAQFVEAAATDAHPGASADENHDQQSSA